jgi:hypothetical protein
MISHLTRLISGSYCENVKTQDCIVLGALDSEGRADFLVTEDEIGLGNLTIKKNHEGALEFLITDRL